MISPEEEMALRKSAQRSLLLRILSALFLIPLVLFITHQGGGIFTLMLVVFAVIMSIEWSQPVYEKLRTPSFIVQVLTSLLAIAAAASGSSTLAIIGLAIIVAGTALVVLIDVSNRRSPFWPLIGIPYVAFFCYALVWLRADPFYGRDAVFWIFAVVWATDTAAFAVGSTLGGAKLWPRVSPNKTWSGLVGGMLAGGWIGAVAGAMLLGSEAAFVPLALLGVFLGGMTQAGDLAESAFKRHFGLKDSGRLIPGHGGLLDRIDGLVFAGLAAAVIALMRADTLGQAGAVLIW